MPPRRIATERRRRGLCFTWPKYIGHRPRGSPFWAGLHADIISDLKLTPLFLPRNSESNLCTARTLRYVPQQYRFGDGDCATLFDLPSNGPDRFHLAFEYDDVWNELSELGVERLSIDELCREFEQWVAQFGTTGIRDQPVAWHERVSQLFYGNQSLLARLRRLPIIPLRDGSWVSAEFKSGYVYLDSESESEDKVPAGLDISIVDPTASRNQRRRQFFQFLGITAYSPRKVCDAIIRLHRDLERRPTTALISDAAYLFKNRSLLREYYGPPELFFVVIRHDRRERKKLCPIYCDDPRASPNLIKQYRCSPENPFSTLDDEAYAAEICADEVDPSARAQRKAEFIDWLLRSDTFRSVPMLVQNHRLTEGWTFLRNANVIDLLHALRHYVDSNRVLPRVLVRAVPELQVRCRDGKRRRLGLLALPTEELMRECPHIDFVDLPGSALSIRSTWGFLSQFGVLRTCDTSARLRELQVLRETFPADQVDKEAVHGIYRALNSAMNADDNKIK